jgi:2-polyprenyl-6-methoxyphenol hydroxylase-like FAD-dependent oxidoreductase
LRATKALLATPVEVTIPDPLTTIDSRQQRSPVPSDELIRTGCCIAGGGPAGMMLGFLLARAGVEVVVLEKHADFLRDFRGDTIHPSTLEVMYELGLLEEFLRRPHQELAQLAAQIGDTYLTIADFSHLATQCKFIAFTPQWEFLNFLAEQAKRYPTFQLRMQAEVTGLIHEGGRVTGVEAKTPGGQLRVAADLVVGADGRGSTVRAAAALETIDLGAPMDALWMQLSKGPGDPGQTFGRIAAGQILALIDRGDYWQCAYVIPKGGFEEIRRRGLPALREAIATLAPFFRDRVQELKDWSEIKLLTVRVDRLREWYRPGLLCLGDAAHAMSPIGGVGINLAVQDAVAAANILAEPLGRGTLTTVHLEAVQRRRELPTRVTQGVQLFMQNRVIRNVLASRQQQVSLPLALRLLRRWRWLQRVPAYLVGVGVRPEHVRVPPAPNA